MRDRPRRKAAADTPELAHGHTAGGVASAWQRTCGLVQRTATCVVAAIVATVSVLPGHS